MSNEPIDWMPDQPLENVKHELFCLYHMQGHSIEDCGTMVGIKNPVEVKQRWDVRQRMMFLQTLTMHEARVPMQRWAQELKAVAMSNVTDVVEWGVREPPKGRYMQDPVDGEWVDMRTGERVTEAQTKEGEPYVEVKGSDMLPPHVSRAIKKLTVDVLPMGGGHRVTIEMHDKMKAMDMLGKHLGAYDTENVERKMMEAEVITPEHAQKVIERGLDQLSNEELARERELAWATANKQPIESGATDG